MRNDVREARLPQDQPQTSDQTEDLQQVPEKQCACRPTVDIKSYNYIIHLLQINV